MAMQKELNVQRFLRRRKREEETKEPKETKENKENKENKETKETKEERKTRKKTKSSKSKNKDESIQSSKGIQMSTTEKPELEGSKAMHPTKQLTMMQQGDKILEGVAKKTKLPFFAILLIFIVIIGVLLVVFYCFLQKWWKKFRESEKGQKFKGLDLKSVNLIGQMGKEKVQPESENLTTNMEQNEVEQKNEPPKEREKLGRLQYKLDYDFNNNTLTVVVIQAEDLPGNYDAFKILKQKKIFLLIRLD